MLFQKTLELDSRYTGDYFLVTLNALCLFLCFMVVVVPEWCYGPGWLHAAADDNDDNDVEGM